MRWGLTLMEYVVSGLLLISSLLIWLPLHSLMTLTFELMVVTLLMSFLVSVRVGLGSMRIGLGLFGLVVGGVT